MVEFTCGTLTKSLKEACSWLATVNISNNVVCKKKIVWDNVVYKGMVDISNKTWYVCSVQCCVHEYSSNTLVCVDID